MREKLTIAGIPVAGVSIAIAMLAVADYMRPSKQAERRAARQAEINRLTEERAKAQEEETRQAELQRAIREEEEKRRAKEAKERRWKAERDEWKERYKNNDWRTQAELYFFKGIKYSHNDNPRQAYYNFRLARDRAGPNEIKEMNKIIRSGWGG